MCSAALAIVLAVVASPLVIVIGMVIEVAVDAR